MALNLSNSQLQQIADVLFLLKTPKPTPLPKPTTNTSGAGSLGAELDSKIAGDRRFQDFGVGIVDFTTDVNSPRVWVHNEDDSWRVGSTGKIAILLAAAQLRDDVREVKKTGIISTASDFDELFSLPKLWGESRDIRIRGIAGPAHAPRISTIFDFAKSPIDFSGPNPDAPDGTAIFNKLGVKPDGTQIEHLSWPAAHDFEFSERLWLCGARSDNVAAATCVSEIGVDYLKAVQRAYGLFDDRHGMHLLVTANYSNLVRDTPVNNKPNSPKYRPFQNQEYHPVKDALFNTVSKKFDDQRSTEPGSAAALTAYMIALMRDKLVAPGPRGIDGCETIRKNLAGATAHSLTSYVSLGVKTVTTVTKEHTKIGILRTEDGEPAPLNCEFNYFETRESNAGGKQMKYSVMVAGIRSKPQADGSPGLNVVSLTENIGLIAHRSLLAFP